MTGHWRHGLQIAVLVGASLLILLFAGRWLFRHYFELPRETSFAATVTTTELMYTTSGIQAEPEGADAGLFAPTELVDLGIAGCSLLRAEDAPDTTIPCAAHQMELRKVRLDQLTMAAGTKVFLSISGGRLHVRVVPQPGAQLAVVVQAIESSKRVAGNRWEALGVGEWRVEPAELGLELALSAHKAGVIPDETSLAVQAGSQMLFESAGESALVGDQNQLFVAKVKTTISLKDSRLELDDLQGARIRHLSAGWTDKQGYTSLHAIVSGRSSSLLVHGLYTDEASNEALSRFDSFAAGRSTRSLVAAATTAGFFAALLTGGALLFQTVVAWWSYVVARKTYKDTHKEALRKARRSGDEIVAGKGRRRA